MTLLNGEHGRSGPIRSATLMAAAFAAALILQACGTGVRTPMNDGARLVAGEPAYAIEAESLGTLGSFQTGESEAASAGAFLVQPSGVQPSVAGAEEVAVVFNVATAGAYSLWVRAKSPDASYAVAALGFNGSTSQVEFAASGAYVWVEVERAFLTVGGHRVSLGYGDPGVHLDLFGVVAAAEVAPPQLEALRRPPRGSTPPGKPTPPDEREPEQPPPGSEPTEPAPEEPEPTEPEPEEPVPEEPEPTEPEPEEPAPEEPEPQEPPEDPAGPPDGGRFSPSLRGDPNFNPASLSGSTATWYQRVVHSIANPVADLDPMRMAASDDLYTYGRSLQLYVQGVLLAFRMTGDLALLDHVDAIAERMRAELRDPWRGTKDGKDGTTDGYVNWVWRYSSGDQYVGKDTHMMDEMKTHALVAMIAVALDTNRDLASPSGRNYGAHADFWRDYLVNTFEAKWRGRQNRPTGFPIMVHVCLHTYHSWMKWHYYMGILTGDARYTTEANRMADVLWAEMRPVNTPSGVAYVWPRTLYIPGYIVDRVLMPSVYASYVYADVVELHLEGFNRWASVSEVQRFARTFTEFMLDAPDPVKNGFARDVGGGVPRADLPSDPSWARRTVHQYGRSGLPMMASWDATGAMDSFINGAYAVRGSHAALLLESGAFASNAWTPATSAYMVGVPLGDRD